ncbi:MAG: hypothetical protein OHK0013_40800 [Sandaracinaceae bacterium]
MWWVSTLLAVWLWSGSSAAQTPEGSTPPAAWFRYRTERTVTNGTGEYAGYSDSLVAQGRYAIAPPSANGLRIRALYAWRYMGESCDQGFEDRIAEVALPSRLYVGRTDLDDYDEHEGPLAVWAWVPPTLVAGDGVRILERDFVVTGVEEVEIAGRTVRAIVASTQGRDERDDAYGRFRTRFTDTYWFDAATGYFLRSLYEEVDENERASFEWTERVQVTAASYLDGTEDHGAVAVGDCPSTSQREEPREDSDWLLYAALLALVVAGWLATRPRAPEPTAMFETERVSRAEEVPTSFGLTQIGPFVPHLARCALRAGETVMVARSADGRFGGIGWTDRAQRVAWIDASDGDACEAIRRALGVEEFFSSRQFATLPSVAEAARASGRSAPHAYNVLDRVAVWSSNELRALAYDAERVVRIDQGDLAALVALVERVRGTPDHGWVAACVAEGDLALGIRDDRGLVGAVLLTVAGPLARLHTLVVAEEARGRGHARELVRAALSKARALGAQSVVAEVHDSELGAMSLLREAGFEPRDTLWLLTASAVRTDRKIARR